MAGMQFAVKLSTYKDWLPGVAGTDPRLGYRFGASITKRGLAPAPFFNSRCLLRGCSFREAATKVVGPKFRECLGGPAVQASILCIHQN